MLEQMLFKQNISVKVLLSFFSAPDQVLREGELGSLEDDDVPLVYCVRLLCSQFLLTGYPQGLAPDRKVTGKPQLKV